MGDQCEATGHDAMAAGEICKALGPRSISLGYDNEVTLLSNVGVALGAQNEVSGSYGVALGEANTVSSQGGIALGCTNTSSGLDAVSIGRWTQASGTSSITIGRGVSGSLLNNTIGNSLMVGFNSDIPTFLVTPSAGVGTQGRVGVGLTGLGLENPTELLDVDGTARLRLVPQQSADCLLLGQNVNNNANDNRIVRLDFNGNPGTFLANDGTWQIANGSALANNGLSIAASNVQLGNIIGATSAQFLNDREIPMNNFNLVFSEPGNPNAGYNNLGVGLSGIGSEVPSEKIDVDGTIRVRQLPNSTPNSIITGVGTGSDLILNHFAFNGDGSTVLGGDATWVSPGALVCEWNEVTNGTSNDLVMGYTASCNEGRVGIGTSTPGSKFTVNFLQDNTQSGTTVHVRSTQQTGNNSGSDNIAGKFEAVGREGRVFGLWGEATADAAADNSGTDMLVGVVGRALASQNAEICFYDQVIGVYGEGRANQPPCNASDWGGYFVGGLNTTGPTIFASDAMLKTDVIDMADATSILLNLKPKYYSFNNEEFPQMGLGEGTHCGLIAQEVEEILPDLVEDIIFPTHFDSDGNIDSESFSYKGLNYIELIPILIGGFQEQQAQISSLTEQLNACCSDVKSLNLPIDEETQVVLKNVSDENQKPILYQNTPNPHGGQCSIRYFVPESNSACEIHFFDNYGNLVKAISIPAKGMGQLNVDAQDLSAGSYTYALVIDGEVKATRVMLKQ